MSNRNNNNVVFVSIHSKLNNLLLSKHILINVFRLFTVSILCNQFLYSWSAEILGTISLLEHRTILCPQV